MFNFLWAKLLLLFHPKQTLEGLFFSVILIFCKFAYYWERVGREGEKGLILNGRGFYNRKLLMSPRR